MTILMLLGGRDTERHASWASVQFCAPLFDESIVIHDVRQFDTLQDQAALREALRRVPYTCVFNNTHGGNCGNGVLQMMLRESGVPYTNSGPLTSAIALDKTQTVDHLRRMGLVTPSGATMTKQEFLDCVDRASSPEFVWDKFVIKQLDGGSSNGLMLLDARHLDDLDHEDVVDGPLRVEEYVEGPEVTVVMLGRRVLGVVEIVLPPMSVFTTEAKYGATPAEKRIAAFDTSRCEVAATRAGLALGLEGAWRADMRVRADGTPVVFEVNTQPAMLNDGIYMKAARLHGNDREIMRMIVDEAVRTHA